MSILAVYGSLREASNTNKLVKQAAEASGHTWEKVELAKAEIKPCTGCGMCLMNEGQCPIDDDMQPLYDMLMSAEALIIGSPTYYMDVSGAVKNFIDRSMAIFYRGAGPEYNPDMPWLGQRPLAGKPSLPVITVAGGGHERALETLKLFLESINRMQIAAEVAEPVGMNDVDDMPEVLERARAAGKALGLALGTSR
jgi:multimeric flavodoxin WrbA